MAARKQADSDPLPYVQVDRSVKPRAALLAGSIGVTPQHALGSLVEWWDLNGDPRELERIATETAAGAEPAVLVTSEAAAARFRLASGKDIDPITLVHLGLLEPAGDRFRVRGMSRYFEPVLGRIRARKAAAAGGKASVESRRASSGTAQPRSAAGSEFASKSGQASIEADSEATPKQPRSDAEAGPNPSGQRSAVSGQSKEGSSASASTPPLQLEALPAKAVRTRKPPDPAAEFARFRDACTEDERRVFRAYGKAFDLPDALAPDWGLLKFVRGKLQAHHVEELEAAVAGAGREKWHREKGTSLRALLSDASTVAQLAKRGAA